MTKGRQVILFLTFAAIGIFLTLLINDVVFPAGQQAVQIGEVVCIRRVIGGNDVIKIIRVQDPDNPFVSIFFTTIESGKIFAMADPSNTAIAARLTGEIPVNEKGEQIINKNPSEDIAHISKSIGSKTMRIARFYDQKMNTLTYLVYTTKLLDGSLKHSLSVVPLGKPLTP